MVINFRKNFEIGGEGGGAISDPKNFVANSVLVVMILEKIATFFPKKGGGGRGVKGRLELFQKFIDNGPDRRP